MLRKALVSLMCNDLENGEKNHIFYLELVIPYSYSDYLTNVTKMGALYKNVRFF